MQNLNRTQKLTRIAVLAAITLIFVMTPLGYIPINPLITVTIMVTPVVIGGMLYGYSAGILLSLIFGISSFMRAPTEPIGQIMLAQSAILTFAACVIPRLLIGLFAGAMNKVLTSFENLRRIWFYALAGFVGSLINTVLFLGFISLAFNQSETQITGKVILGIVTGNGVFEMIANAILVAILSKALLKLSRSPAK